jgi:hypothetical protein
VRKVVVVVAAWEKRLFRGRCVVLVETKAVVEDGPGKGTQ